MQVGGLGMRPPVSRGLIQHAVAAGISVADRTDDASKERGRVASGWIGGKSNCEGCAVTESFRSTRLERDDARSKSPDSIAASGRSR